MHLRVPVCSKEPSNSADIDVSADSPLLAEMLRAYRPVAIEHNDGFLFIPGSLSARKKRSPRAMMALVRPVGECPHAGQCTRCHEVLAACRTSRGLAILPARHASFFSLMFLFARTASRSCRYRLPRVPDSM